MSLYDFIVPLGITGFVIILLSVMTGLFKKILPARIRLRIHKFLGLTVLLIAAVHGAIVLYYQFFA